ncbi:MAG: hypothetical protein DWI22_14680 [Planctomycetota bacterium]|nr:MAG: hypothetical protein DWI22_14680 [Planctomycetota bacterium]
MIDLPNTENLRAFAAAILRFQRLSEGIPESDHWRWLLFDKDLQSNAKFSRGSVGPTVSLGLPWLSADCSLRWLAPRLFFWPQGIPGGHRVSLISSRLKQRLDEESWWFDLLRTATLRSHPTSDILCAVTGTAAHRFVRRAAEIFGRSLLEFQVDARDLPGTDADIVAWLAETGNCVVRDSSAIPEEDMVSHPPAVEGYAAGTHWSVFVSPRITLPDNSAKSDALPGQIRQWSKQPIADRILFAAGERLQVLRARRGGAVQALLMQHVQDSERCNSLVMLASDADGQIPAIELETHDCLIPWLLKSSSIEVTPHNHFPSSIKDGQASGGTLGCTPTAEDSSAVSTLLTDPDAWLLHWTRSTVGPWPHQDEQEFHDELILKCRSSDRSVLATLLRIVTEGHLWASSETIRGGFEVVSFTEVPLHDFRRRRAYRKHRRRYDFEPWGIGIRRDLLALAGARPVEYGNEETWQTTPEGARPFFQNVGSGDGWTEDEREWRLVGNIQLHKLPPAAVVVFVDTKESRSIVQKQTEWQVIVVPNERES